MYTSEELKCMSADKAVRKAVLMVSFNLSTTRHGRVYINRVAFERLLANVTDPMSDDPFDDYVYLQRGRISLFPAYDYVPECSVDVDKDTGNRLYLLMKHGNKAGYCSLLKSLGIDVL